MGNAANCQSRRSFYRGSTAEKRVETADSMPTAKRYSSRESENGAAYGSSAERPIERRVSLRILHTIT